MKKIIMIIFLTLLMIKNSNAQKSVVNEINYCIAIEKSIQNPFQGLGIVDTNKTIQVVIQFRNMIDTTVIGFDKQGRVNYLKNFYEVTHVEYRSNGLTKRIRRNPQPYCPDKDVVYLYEYNKDGYITSIKENCGGKTTTYLLKHVVLPVGRVVETYQNGKQISTDVFLFKPSSFFEWQTVTDKLVKLNYKRDQFKMVAKLENVVKYNEVQIEQDGDGLNKSEYTLLDSEGKEIGTIKVLR